MKILKFGGSSLAAPDTVRRVLEIVHQARRESPLAMVVSAFGRGTDDLVAAAERAGRRDESYLELWSALRDRHFDAARELAPAESDALTESLRHVLDDLKDLLRGVYLLRECSPRTLDSISAYGEGLAAEVVAAALRGVGLAALLGPRRRRRRPHRGRRRPLRRLQRREPPHGPRRAAPGAGGQSRASGVDRDPALRPRRDRHQSQLLHHRPGHGAQAAGRHVRRTGSPGGDAPGPVGGGPARGRLRACPLYDYRFVVLSHNTLRGAAGGAVLVAELAVARGLIK